MIGTVVNTIAIIVGAGLGILIGSRLSSRFKETAMQGIGLAVILIGLNMALETNSIIIVIFSLLLGGIIGEILRIESRLHNVGKWFEKRMKKESQLAEAFMQCSLIYCVGAMAIMGALQDGLLNDPSTLYAKSLLDGFSAIAFASTLGPGVFLSAIPVFIYQGTISLLSAFLQPLLTEQVITEMTAVGGLLIVGIGLNLLEITEIKVGNLLPGLFMAVVLSLLVL